VYSTEATHSITGSSTAHLALGWRHHEVCLEAEANWRLPPRRRPSDPAPATSSAHQHERIVQIDGCDRTPGLGV